MSNKVYILLFLLTAGIVAHAQNEKKDIGSIIKYITADDISRLPNVSVDLTGILSFGKPSDQYGIGFGARVVYSNNPYGFIKDYGAEKQNNSNAVPASAIENIEVLDRQWGWHAGVGYIYLPGKEEDMGPISYKYDNFSILHVFGGVDYDPCPKGDIQLSVGPAMGLFPGGENELGFGASLNGFYAFQSSPNLLSDIVASKKGKPVFGATGGISFYKFKDIDPLYTVSVGVRMTF